MKTQMYKSQWLFILLILLLPLMTACGAIQQAGEAVGQVLNVEDKPLPEAGTPSEVQAQSNGDSGVVVTGVEPGSPAAEAGLVRGDILLAVDDTEINSLAELRETLNDHSAGDSVDLSIRHGDEQLTLEAELDEKEDLAYLGVSVCCGSGGQVSEFTPPTVEDMMLDSSRPLITAVMPDSPADQAGIRPGDLIVSIDGQEIRAEDDLAELIEEYEPGDEISLAVQQFPNGEARTLELVLGENPEKEGRAYLGVRYTPAPMGNFFRGEGRLPEDFEFMPFANGQFEMPFEGFPPGFEFHKGMPFQFDFPIPEDGELQGVLIAEVAAGSPASDAGLQEDDLLVAIDGMAIESPQAVGEAMRAKSPGDEVTLTVMRSGEESEIELLVELGKQPDEAGGAYLGVTLGGFIQINQSGDGLPGFGLPGGYPPIEVPGDEDASF